VAWHVAVPSHNVLLLLHGVITRHLFPVRHCWCGSARTDACALWRAECVVIDLYVCARASPGVVKQEGLAWMDFYTGGQGEGRVTAPIFSCTRMDRLTLPRASTCETWMATCSASVHSGRRTPSQSSESENGSRAGASFVCDRPRH
jgi:hypothetical protein